MERLNLKKEEINETVILKELKRLCNESKDLLKLSLTNEGHILIERCISDLLTMRYSQKEQDAIVTYEKINTIIDEINNIIRNYSVQKVVLKSTHPEEYPDLTIECRVIPNDKISEYLESIPEERKFYAYKNKPVKARRGKVGEEIQTTLKTIIDGKEYILKEEKNTVKERTYTKKTTMKNGEVIEEEITAPDMVITNYHSTSNEEYVVKHQKFIDTYEFVEDIIKKRYGFSPRYMPKYDSRLLTQVNENIIIMTSWGEPAVCLAGSYIVTYNAEENDYNTIEQGAFESTYTKEDSFVKKLKR